MSDFAARVDAFLVEFFALHPLTATSAGMHLHDGEWPDMSPAGRAARLAFYDRWTEELEGIDEAVPALMPRRERLERGAHGGIIGFGEERRLQRLKGALESYRKIAPHELLEEPDISADLLQ